MRELNEDEIRAVISKFIAPVNMHDVMGEIVAAIAAKAAKTVTLTSANPVNVFVKPQPWRPTSSTVTFSNITIDGVCGICGCIGCQRVLQNKNICG